MLAETYSVPFFAIEVEKIEAPGWGHLGPGDRPSWSEDRGCWIDGRVQGANAPESVLFSLVNSFRLFLTNSDLYSGEFGFHHPPFLFESHQVEQSHSVAAFADNCSGLLNATL